MGIYSADNWLDKLRGTLRVYSSLFNWSIENAVDTGLSMKARGYGLKGRIYFSQYCFKKDDAILLVTNVVLITTYVCFLSCGYLDFQFYPYIVANDWSADSIVPIVIYAILAFSPCIFEIKEVVQWKYYESKI